MERGDRERTIGMIAILWCMTDEPLMGLLDTLGVDDCATDEELQSALFKSLSSRGVSLEQLQPPAMARRAAAETRTALQEIIHLTWEETRIEDDAEALQQNAASIVAAVLRTAEHVTALERAAGVEQVTARG